MISSGKVHVNLHLFLKKLKLNNMLRMNSKAKHYFTSIKLDKEASALLINEDRISILNFTNNLRFVTGPL